MTLETVELQGKDLRREPTTKGEMIGFICGKFLEALDSLGVTEITGEVEKENEDRFLITVNKVGKTQ